MRELVPSHLTQGLGLRKVCAKMLPKNLTIEQKRTYSKAVRLHPNAPYLSSRDFFSLAKIKIYLNGHHLDAVDNIQSSMTKDLREISIGAFQH